MLFGSPCAALTRRDRRGYNPDADSARSLILEQVTNGIAVRMAVLFLINGGKGPQEIAGT